MVPSLRVQRGLWAAPGDGGPQPPAALLSLTLWLPWQGQRDTPRRGILVRETSAT